MLEQLSNSLNLIVEQTQTHAYILGMIVAVLWAFYFLSLIDKRILILGIIPRTIQGLPGIIFSPLLHADFNHVFFNTIPLIVLSNFLLINGLDFFILATIFIGAVTGSLIWLFGKPGLHIGASGLITGYWALLVADIYQQGTLTAIILGGISLYYFAGIFLGIFPMKKGISWEGHLFGLLSGLGFAYLIDLHLIM